MNSLQNIKLSKEFYLRDVNTVAKELLGKIFCRSVDGKIFSGRIVEVEAYSGKIDEAAHSFNGKTERNKVMFDEGGCLYVYFIYGVHNCLNVVTGEREEANAVLIRGIEPIEGIDHMSLNRFGNKNSSLNQTQNLTNGPGKICKAFGIDRSKNGTNLLGNDIFIVNDKEYRINKIVETTRIGISKSKNLCWRYYLKNNPYVSKL